MGFLNDCVKAIIWSKPMQSEICIYNYNKYRSTVPCILKYLVIYYKSKNYTIIAKP